MIRSHRLTRWLKLLLACFALITTAPAQAMASAGTVAQVVGGRGGPPLQRPTKAPSLRAQWTPVAARWDLARVQFAGFQPGSEPRCSQKHLFILHRALLR